MNGAAQPSTGKEGFTAECAEDAEKKNGITKAK